ncbi:MAG: hypothetical protein DRR08_23015 [Candidatus Parabeggiatoa sp. nov. 2]|nr:MAG: hypothetical protein B6247_24030 [Beggiatoa sp. 4572_84]RKZ55916.1 MAG: hypothetical protein DRR08_23015 [Gammaproteobacteria bacterium]HEC84776.1 hypothetical protein [Thioploca sp.]
MSYLILEHLTCRELPAEWAKHLPAGQTFTVSIIAENPVPQPSTYEPVIEKKGTYAYLRQLKKNFFDPS